MHPADEEDTTSIINKGLYCYKVIPFGLQNTGVTYQRLVNKMFAKQIGKTMEVYVNNMLVKSAKARQHIEHLGKMFNILRKYHMKLNLLKCTFGVGFGKVQRSLLEVERRLGKPPVLPKPKPGEKLSLYLLVYEHAVSSVLNREEGKI